MRKKKEKKKEENPAKHEKKDKKESQIKWVILGMVGIVLISALVYFFIQESKKFEYGGLNFEKIMFGKIQLYQSKMPLRNSAGGLVANYNLYLRNDPRKLGNISIEGVIGLENKNLIVSLDPDVETGCEDSGIAGANFFSFFKVAGYNTKIAYTNKTYAKERNASFSNCQENFGPYYDFIVIKRDNKTEIVKKEENCYEIHFKECDILNATERFIVATIANSKGIIV